ncbi:hypothetical protein Btru_030984 [Bulinus truncatus]|nr:hypothetical protein Btru_030984 [Bulinus truncatus]
MLGCKKLNESIVNLRILVKEYEKHHLLFNMRRYPVNNEGMPSIIIYWPLLLVSIPYINGKLLLTPYIRANNIDVARNLSFVQDNSGVIPRSYSGFITADEQLGNHLFFWLFPAEDPNAALLVWLNGGPTVSSMIGLFYENGPLRAISGDAFVRWNSSWVNSFSMLYIDNPVGTGFSHTDSDPDGYRTTQEGYAKDLYSFIEQFYVLFPEYMNVELYIGGQSYAGKYVPAFVHYLHTKIEQGLSNLPLKGIYIGGPYFDPRSQSEFEADYFYSIGAVSLWRKFEYKKRRLRFWEKFDAGELNMTDFSQINTALLLIDHSKDNYVTRKSANYAEVESLMNRIDMKSLVHAMNVTFRSYHGAITIRFLKEYLVGTKHMLAALLDNYKVLIYTGDLDTVTSSIIVDAGLMSTPWSMLEEYKMSRRSSWKNEGVLVGFFTLTGQFCRVVIRGAGHHVPHDQPDISHFMMRQFVQHGCVR